MVKLFTIKGLTDNYVLEQYLNDGTNLIDFKKVVNGTNTNLDKNNGTITLLYTDSIVYVNGILKKITS